MNINEYTSSLYQILDIIFKKKMIPSIQKLTQLGKSMIRWMKNGKSQQSILLINLTEWVGNFKLKKAGTMVTWHWSSSFVNLQYLMFFLYLSEVLDVLALNCHSKY